MNIEERKQEIRQGIEIVRADIERLKANLDKAAVDLELVKTEEDAREFDRTHDVEDGLVHIRLY